jgi:hypothetical protein
MASERCPSCRQMRNLRVTTSIRTVRAADGRKKRLRTVSYHCETCNRFVRSEEMEEAGSAGD